MDLVRNGQLLRLVLVSQTFLIKLSRFSLEKAFVIQHKLSKVGLPNKWTNLTKLN